MKYKEQLKFSNIELVCPCCGVIHYVMLDELGDAQYQSYTYDKQCGCIIIDADKALSHIDINDKHKLIDNLCDNCRERLFGELDGKDD